MKAPGSPSFDRSAEAMAVETLKRGSSGRLPAALGAAVEQGRCLLLCTLGLINVLSPVPSLWSGAGSSLHAAAGKSMERAKAPASLLR